MSPPSVVDALALLFVPPLATAWFFYHLVRGRLAVARPAAVMAGLTWLGVAARVSHWAPWEQGGWAMTPVLVIGAYAAACGVAARTGSPGARQAAWTSVGVMLSAAIVAREVCVGQIESAMVTAPAADALSLYSTSMSEVWRPVQLAVLLGLVVAVLLRRRPRQQAASRNSLEYLMPSTVR